MCELNTFKITLGVISVLIGSLLVWRVSSRRYMLPCPSWLAWMVERDNPFTKVNRAATIIEHLDLKQGMMVLDVGCGPGRLTIPLARKIGPNGQVVALDIQAAMLAKVQEKARLDNLTNITFIEAGIGQGKLEHNFFDRVLMVTVLGEIPDRQAALKEIFDSLKPGGILCVTEVIFDPHFQRQSTVLNLAREAGFKEKSIFGSWFSYLMNFEKPQ